MIEDNRFPNQSKTANEAFGICTIQCHCCTCLASSKRMRMSFSSSPTSASFSSFSLASSHKLDSKWTALHLWIILYNYLSKFHFDKEYPEWDGSLWCCSHLARHWFTSTADPESVLYWLQDAEDIALLGSYRLELWLAALMWARSNKIMQYPSWQLLAIAKVVRFLENPGSLIQWVVPKDKLATIGSTIYLTGCQF